MATKVKPCRIKATWTPQVWYVPKYVDEDTFQWWAWWGGWGGDVSWPASSTDWDVVLFDWATWKVIKDSWVNLSSKLDASALSDNNYWWAWSWDTTHTPTKNAIYTKIHTMDVEIWNKAADNTVVKLSWNQTIWWTKTFSTSPVVPSKTTDATNTWTAIATEAQVYKKAEIVYATQAEYEALLPWALTDNKHYFIYEEEVWPTPPTPASRPTITWFTYDSKSFWFGSQEQEVQWMIWKPDWTKFYLEWEWSDHVYQYSCSTAYDISTASYDNVSLDVSWKTGVPTNIRMKPDGTQLYLVWGWDSPNHIWIYNLGTAWDLSTAVYSAESPQIDSNTNSIFLSPDWLNLFTYSLNTYLLKRFPLSTAWDLTSFSTADQTASLNNNNNVQNVYFNPDGTQMFSLVRTGSWTKVGLYSLSTGWDLTTLSNTSTETIDSWDAMAISFKEDDWSKMYLCWRTNPNRTIYQYSTTTA